MSEIISEGKISKRKLERKISVKIKSQRGFIKFFIDSFSFSSSKKLEKSTAERFSELLTSSSIVQEVFLSLHESAALVLIHLNNAAA